MESDCLPELGDPVCIELAVDSLGFAACASRGLRLFLSGFEGEMADNRDEALIVWCIGAFWLVTLISEVDKEAIELEDDLRNAPAV